ncbi:ATP-dependent DNA ligase [Candidatus Woesearchaeota archaeon]|nr:ATP-dependent DNA ligase [Candidatus Woesearchaeota archaeon]
MKFGKIVDVFEPLEKVTSGNKIRSILADFFKKCPASELKVATYLLSGRISSEYKGVITGMSNKLVLRSVSIAAKKDLKKVNELFKRTGDAGLTAQQLVGRRRESLSVKKVFQSLHKIAGASGAKSQDFKIKELANLLRIASSKEAKYIARLVVGKMRLGAGDRAILDALSIAFTGSKEARKELDKAYQANPDLGYLAEMISRRKIRGIKTVGVVFKRPIKVMLAQRAKSFQEIFEKIKGEMAVEEKYDGERMQVHVQGKNIRIFSRRLEDISRQYPDVIDCIRRNIRCKSCILDGEGCAVDKKGRLLSFQLLMQRRRKYDVEKYIKKIPVCLFLFDLLFLNGKSCLQEDYPARYKALKSVVKKQTSCAKLANRIVTKNPKKIQSFFNKMLKKGAEGVMIKSMENDSVYKAGTRGWLWIKWKKEYAKGMVDTFDLVVVGAFRGHGKRAGSYGSLLCAVYNSKTRKFETFTKLGSGFTDKQLKELPKIFRKYESKEKDKRVSAKKELKPDLWFKPVIVVEVLGAEITKSPLHTAEGLALRFPRFLRFRPDKSAYQATSVKEILNFYKKK